MADASLSAGGIYAIRNTVNGKRYVGSASSFSKRWGNHRNDLARGVHHSSHLQRAWKKYGEAAFVFEILQVCRFAHELTAAEQVWLDRLDAVGMGYNICPVAGNCTGRPIKPETLEKMRRSRIGFRHTEETKARVSAAVRLRLPEIIANSIRVHTGRKRSAETRLRQSLAQIGKTHSAETKQKLADISRNMPQAQRDKIAASLRGRPGKKHTPEAIALMSQRKREGWARRKAAGSQMGLPI